MSAQSPSYLKTTATPTVFSSSCHLAKDTDTCVVNWLKNESLTFLPLNADLVGLQSDHRIGVIVEDEVKEKSAMWFLQSNSCV